MADLRELLGMDANVRQLASLLRAKAPPGEHLAYINDHEAQMLKAHGGSGRPTQSGIPSYSTDGDSSTFDSGSQNFYTQYEPTSFVQDAPRFGDIQPQSQPAPDMGGNAGGDMSFMQNTPNLTGAGGAYPTIANPYGGMQPTLGIQGQFTGGAGQGGTTPAQPGMSLDSGASVAPTAPQQPGFLQSLLNSGSKAIQNLPEGLAKALPGIVGAGFGARAAKGAVAENKANLAPVAQNNATLNAIGNQQLQNAQMQQNAAYEGQLTPAQIQQNNAVQAQLAQAASRSGGTIGALQTANAEQANLANERQQNINLATSAMNQAFGSLQGVSKDVSEYAQNLLKSDQQYAAEFGKLMQNIGSILG